METNLQVEYEIKSLFLVCANCKNQIHIKGYDEVKEYAYKQKAIYCPKCGTKHKIPHFYFTTYHNKKSKVVE